LAAIELIQIIQGLALQDCLSIGNKVYQDG